MKRIITISSIIIAILLMSIIIFTSNNKTLKKEGITYALTVDGKKVNSFPDKGSYKVNVNCTNALGSWDYDNWKLDIEDIKGEITCGISFDTTTPKKLNEYIMELDESIEGNGKLINEKAKSPNYDNISKLTKNDYKDMTQYSTTNNNTTIDTDLSVFKFNSNSEWELNKSDVKSEIYYNLKFTVPSDGYYQTCFNLESGHTSNYLSVSKNSSQMFYNFASTSGEVNVCREVGYVPEAAELTIVYRPYADDTNGMANLKISIQKVELADSNNYRYEGQNPNNFVKFNNELWRIIGVFGGNTHGQKGLNLVKLIRNESIGGLVWSKNSSMIEWKEETNLYNLLNNEYLHSSSVNTQNCYSTNTITANCDYSAIGINSAYLPMIKEVTWKTGKHNQNDITTSQSLYIEERGKLNINNTQDISFSINGFIGLMYPSDYGYSILESDCSRTTSLHSYGTCTDKSWIATEGNEWTITSLSNYTSVMYFTEYGSLNSSQSSQGKTVRPTLYLNENVYILGGTGTELDPYIIGM